MAQIVVAQHNQFVNSMNLSKLHVFDVFDWYEVSVMSIDIVHELVFIIYVCKHDLEK